MRALPALLVCALTLHFLDIGAASHPRAEAIRQTSTSQNAEQEARLVCGTACRAYPPPDVLPRSAWAGSIARMSLFRAGRPEPQGQAGGLATSVELPPDMARILAFYESHAPESLETPPRWPGVDTRWRFRKHAMSPTHPRKTPAISHVRFVDVDGDGVLDVLATDMRHGLNLAKQRKPGA